ncbi:MAG: hypothetical protein Q4A84_05045 [Neisseria sp.]|uniref:DUF2269 family protein n=1 Tax=Neisseria sp. TaxID=192066 RepID=UPI0026DC2E46|nr:hypothetical protein [Neisseria sp.]MDO4641056.1 hypothetical protein [Neisseria sp.]
MSYNLVHVLHILFAIVAVGPLLFAPWLSLRLKTCEEEREKFLLLKGLRAIDIYYNIAGWGLMLSGGVLLYLHEWHRIFQLWFIFSVLLFIVDSIAEKFLRDPSGEMLNQLTPKATNWNEYSLKMHKAIVIQTVCTACIFILMLLHSRLPIKFLMKSFF